MFHLSDKEEPGGLIQSWFSKNIESKRIESKRIAKRKKVKSLKMSSVNHSQTHVNQYCHDLQKIYRNLDPNAMTSLAAIFFSLGLLGVLMNSFVVFCIHKTKQLDVQSIQLFRNFSIIDIFNSIINFIHLKAIFSDPRQTGCTFNYVLACMLKFSIHSSRMMVPITAIDRYIHIKHHAEYALIFTPLRFKFIHVLYFICTLYQSSITTVIVLVNGTYPSLKYTIPLSCAVVLLTVFLYLKSINLLKQHVNTTTNLTSSKRSIVKITSLYFYGYLFNIAILLAQPFLAKIVIQISGANSSASSVQRVIFHVTPTLIAIVNALAFLWINRKCRALLRSFFKFNNTDSVSTIDN